MEYNIGDIFQIVNTYENEYIDFWARLAEVESPTNYKEGVDRAVALAAQLADKMSWQIKIQTEKISGSPICITMNPDACGKPLVLSGHMDTVHAVGTFGDKPVRIEDGKIYGPGVCDCKGGIVAALYAMRVLSEAGFTERPIRLIIQTDEETSSVGSEKRTVDFMYECARDAGEFINLEAYNPGKATVGRKGILKYTVKVSGMPMHSSLCYEGASAITEAAHKIIKLENLKEREGLTFNCGVIFGGTTANTVAGECTFTVDIRFPNEKEKLRAIGILEDVINTQHIDGTSAVLIKESERCAMEATDKNYALLDKLNSAFERAGLQELEPAFRTGGSDASDMTARGLACVDSLGVTGGYIHTSREYAKIPSLKESCLRIIAVSLFAK